MELKKQSNPEKILMALIEFGPLSKWELKDRASLRYPRVNESIKSLEQHNLIQIVDRRMSKKNLEMKIYGLTFKGALKHLASIDLPQPKTESWHKAARETSMKRLMDEYNIYFTKVTEAKKVLNLYGDKFNFIIFQQIDWLAKNFGLFVIELIIEISKTIKSLSPPVLFRQVTTQQKLKERKKMINQLPFLRNVTPFSDKGEGRKEEQTIDRLSEMLSEIENRILQLELEAPIIQKGENNSLKDSFEVFFLERVACLKRKTGKGNKPLQKLARKLLKQRKKQTISKLERVIKQFGDLESEKN